MITSKKERIQYLEADLKANNVENLSLLKCLLGANKIMFFIYLLRQCEYAKNCEKIWFKFIFLYFKRKSLELGFSIPLNVFDQGLSIPHYGTIVINSNTRVGKNCRLHACVNIGSSAGSRKAPVIGDNVYIGPSVVIFGDVFIADNITIGANSTVNKSFLDKNVVLVGAPAKVAKTNFPVWWENNSVNLN